MKALGACDDAQMFGSNVAKCTFDDGRYAVISTSDSSAGTEMFVILQKGDGKAKCAVVAKGVYLGGSDYSALVRAIGVPESFAARHGGYYLPC